MCRLSILIPAIPSRFEKAKELFERCQQLTQDMDIEIVMVTDNKKRSIGAKREAAKNICNGDFFMFVDDDDQLLSIAKVYEAAAQDVDVISFKQRCRNKDGSFYTVTFNLGNPIEHNSADGIYKDSRRPPWIVCAWNKRFKEFSYPDVNYGEDWGWLLQVLPLAKKEIHIDEVICAYNWDPDVTEASTESNAVWTNPNADDTAFGCIVSAATGPKRYVDGLLRLHNSVQPFEKEDKVDTLCFANIEAIGAPPHNKNPYAFKIYAIEHARNLGYNQVLWLDASIVQVNSAQPIFEWLTKNGIFLEEAGHLVGNWCNAETLNYFKISREQAMQMPMFAAGYCGFDFRNPISIEFFARWKESMLNGCFKGSWNDHRHDMTCGSIIANQMDLVPRFSSGGQFFAYIGEAYNSPKNTVCFHLIGL